MKTINFKIIRTLLACIVLVTLTRCDFILKDDNNLANDSDVNIAAINVKKNEAQLLVKATQHNLDVVGLIEVLKETEINPSVKNLAETIEDNQLEIFERYNELAKENIISIPDYPQVNRKALLQNQDIVVHEVVKKIEQKINRQIDALDVLASTTNNEDFKSLAEVTSEKLVNSLENTDVLKSQIH